MLRRGDQLPDFEAPTVDGAHFRYADVWQHRNLVLITTGLSSPSVVAYLSDLRDRVAALKPDNSTVVAVQNVQALPASSLIVGDRWGEIVFIAALSDDVARWPSSDDVLEWLEMVRQRC